MTLFRSQNYKDSIVKATFYQFMAIGRNLAQINQFRYCWVAMIVSYTYELWVSIFNEGDT